MLNEQKNDSISLEIQKRPDDFFEETNPPKAIRKTEGNLTHCPLAELKSLVLSIDWEITEEVLSDFLIQIDSLGILYKNDQIILKFLKMLKSCGKYIMAHKSDAHPDAFNLLDSVFRKLERITITQDIPDLEKQKLLKSELGKYKELYELISESKRKKEKEAQKKVLMIQNKKKLENNWNINSAKNLDKEMILISKKQLNDAINEIKNYFHSEINNLMKMLVSHHKI